MAKRESELTWQEKLKQGIPLNNLEETKADADYNHRRRRREQEELEAFDAYKRGEGSRPETLYSEESEQTESEKKDGKK